jgi:hypothetical protein
LDEFEFGFFQPHHKQEDSSRYTVPGGPCCSPSSSSLIDVRNISTPFTKTRNRPAVDLDVPPAPRKNRISPNTALKSRELHLLHLSGDASYPSDDNEQKPEVAPCGETNMLVGTCGDNTMAGAGRSKTHLSLFDDNSCDRQVLQARSLDFGEVGEAEEKTTSAAVAVSVAAHHPRTRKEKQVRVKELEKYFRRLDVETKDCNGDSTKAKASACGVLVKAKKDESQIDAASGDQLMIGSPVTTTGVKFNNTFNLQRKRHFGEISSPTVPATPAIDFKEQKRDWRA